MPPPDWVQGESPAWQETVHWPVPPGPVGLHSSPALQAWPQAPQLFGSVDSLTQAVGLAVGQADSPAGHDSVQVGVPAVTLQISPAAQALPTTPFFGLVRPAQKPPLAASMLGLMQVPVPQSTRGSGQERVWQLPLWQMCPAGQMLLQVPAVLRSVVVWTDLGGA